MEKVKWGVLGTAGIAWGQTIPGMVEAGNCELYAIAGRSREKAEAYQKEFGFEKIYLSYDELLDDPAVEAVYIPLPNSMHYEWVLKALGKKKHVLCEKPLAPTPDQVKEMFAAAKQNGVILMEAFAYLHSPLISAVKAELDAGVIGEVEYMESAFMTSDYNHANIRMRRETFGGSLYDLGCYNTSLITWMLGELPETVQGISVWSEDHIDLLSSAVMTYGPRKRAVFTCGMVLTTDEDKRIDRWQIHGTKGSICSDAEFNGKGELLYRVATAEGSVLKKVTVPHNYRLEVEQLGRCIREGEAPHVSEEFSIANAQVLDRILKAVGY